MLHVVDIAHGSFEDHIASVNKILSEIDALDKPTIMVFNKIDQYVAEDYDPEDLMKERTSAHYSLEEWKRTWMAKMGENVVFISAIKKENIDSFKRKVYDQVRKIHIARFPYNKFLFPDWEEFVVDPEEE